MLTITSREMSILPNMERLASTLSRLTCAPLGISRCLSILGTKKSAHLLWVFVGFLSVSHLQSPGIIVVYIVSNIKASEITYQPY